MEVMKDLALIILFGVSSLWGMRLLYLQHEIDRIKDRIEDTEKRIETIEMLILKEQSEKDNKKHFNYECEYFDTTKFTCKLKSAKKEFGQTYNISLCMYDTICPDGKVKGE